MEKHRCKLCYRRFANGRALAGHMRSHVAPARAHRPPLPSPSASASSPLAAAAAEADADEEEEKGSAAYALRENRRRRFRLADPEFSSSAAALQDRESDAESSLRRGSKRRRRSPAAPPAADEPLSSVSDASSEEDVARCLMLLSRDAWSKSEAERQSNGWEVAEGEEYNEEEEEAIGSRSRRQRSRFQCGTCRKVFRSYQALGGHRASHKRVGVECVPTATATRIHGEDSSGVIAAHHDAKLWECPYCYRVFGSGQALGGHKRSHLSSATATTIITTSPVLPSPRPSSPFTVAANNNCSIDLNLPAPLEEEAELSALSVATDFARK